MERKMEENKQEEQTVPASPKPEEPQAPQASQTAPANEQKENKPEGDKAPDKTPDADEQEDESELPEEIWVTDPELPASYNWAWREVINGLMNRMKAYEAYAKAYDIDISTESGRRQAEA